MTDMPQIQTDRTLDVRETPCSIKHGLVVRTLVELAVGEHVILRNGHEPAPIRYQFEAECPGTLNWECVQQSPGDVSMKITKVKAFPTGVTPRSGSGGSCGGH